MRYLLPGDVATVVMTVNIFDAINTEKKIVGYLDTNDVVFVIASLSFDWQNDPWAFVIAPDCIGWMYLTPPMYKLMETK